MSKGKTEETRVEMKISKYLEKHGQDYERPVTFMLRRKYGDVKKTLAEWVTELSEFRQRKVHI